MHIHTHACMSISAGTWQGCWWLQPFSGWILSSITAVATFLFQAKNQHSVSTVQSRLFYSFAAQMQCPTIFATVLHTWKRFELLKAASPIIKVNCSKKSFYCNICYSSCSLIGQICLLLCTDMNFSVVIVFWDVVVVSSRRYRSSDTPGPLFLTGSFKVYPSKKYILS